MNQATRPAPSRVLRKIAEDAAPLGAYLIVLTLTWLFFGFKVAALSAGVLLIGALAYGVYKLVEADIAAEDARAQADLERSLRHYGRGGAR